MLSSTECLIQILQELRPELLLLLSHFSRVRLCTTPQMAAHKAPPSLGFSRQEHWSGVPLPSPKQMSRINQMARRAFTLFKKSKYFQTFLNEGRIHVHRTISDILVIFFSYLFIKIGSHFVPLVILAPVTNYD